MTKPRFSLITSEGDLLLKLWNGQTPEEELYNLFSFWDKD
jgi:hypothetical protein